MGLTLAFALDFPAHGQAGALFILLGGSLATLALLPLVGRAGWASAPWGLRLALRPLRRPTSRHAFAAAALAVAVSMTAGMGIMVRSLEHTAMAMVGENFRADLYVLPLGSTAPTSRHGLGPELMAQVLAHPAVALGDPTKAFSFRLGGGHEVLGVRNFQAMVRHGGPALVAGGSLAQALDRIREGGLVRPGVLVSEGLARRRGLKPGDRLELPFPRGPRTLWVEGVFVGLGQGSLLLDWDLFASAFEAPLASSLPLYLHPGQDAEAVARDLRARFPTLQVQALGGIRAQILGAFRRTFALTYALEAIGLLVALAGLGQALFGLCLERRGELWTLRALGLSTLELRALLVGEGLGIALAGAVAGTTLGLLLSRVLMVVINPRNTGFTIVPLTPWGFLGLVFLAVLAISALVTLPVARWASRLRVDRAEAEGSA